MIKIGINGFGRIGRFVFISAMDSSDIDVVAINDPFMSVNRMVYMLKQDSAQLPVKLEVRMSEHESNLLFVNKNTVKIFAESANSLHAFYLYFF
jgi:glyceraldehyde 3-phosphate dehydrogenase